MTTNNTNNSELYSLYDIVQSSMILWPKELVIEQLRDFFSRDSMYHFATDHFGFPQTPDHTNLPETAGYKDNLTTRLYISSAGRYDVVYYPGLIIRHGGATSVPISINRERACIQWDNLVFEDGYGNIKTLPTPASFIFAGSWEGTITIEVIARDPRTRDDLTELVSLLFTQIACDDMEKNGVGIKPGGVSAGGPTETIDRTDTLFHQTITLQYRSEWRRKIPVRHIIDSINTSVEFGRVDNSSPVAANLTINTQQTLTDLINSL